MSNTTKFSFDTIQDFDDHILKSIPNYDILFQMILSMSNYFVEDGKKIYDLGCSTGKLLKSLPFKQHKVGYDLAENLLPNEDTLGDLLFVKKDLNQDFDVNDASLVYSIFTMQFLRRDRRNNYLKNIYNGLTNGGALILCEKVYQEHGVMQEMFTFSQYDYKVKSFDAQEILNKEKDLRLIMKPDGYLELLERVRSAGFEKISFFWQSFNFIGIIAIK